MLFISFNIVFIGKSDNDKILSTKLNVEKIYNYYKDFDGISCHKLLPNYLKKTEAEEKFGGIDD